ncbi:MAG: hypothetical protein A2Y20_01200 [Firmicutes bacterium GWF2_51_9]|nr:MAG: hypothetical protein A2Y20_01200 [Firmicutes bacterium GWF2_51_9]OGS58351.1 MAG: hypothetical protein A2Y19_08555 [Firmicutes bacterium GWE2_51_13]HAM64171.1 hypothetical protein [Erysipelotrichaceae bacterium]HBZ40794.1 hypothetical protein [Erysipelotrichaceae bacterium]
MEKSSMDRLHAIQLEMALEVKRICEKHAIRYFLVAGTLLGAMRHQGFIPWDDDLDIAMAREDYNRFIEVCKDDLSPLYFLQTSRSEDEFGFLFAKLRKKNTKFVECNAQNVRIDHGVFIDIFPFDNAPDSMLMRRKHALVNEVLRRILLAKLGYSIAKEGQIAKQVLYIMLGLISRLVSKETLRRLIEANATRYLNQETSAFVNLGGSYPYMTEVIPKEWIFPFSYLPFEGQELPVPSNSNAILTQFYGEFKTLPPIGRRQCRHLTTEIDFGEESDEA